jgi:YVTN family beta-propeller protein
MPRLPLLIAVVLLPALAAGAEDLDQLKVGRQADGRIVTPTNQILQPAGRQITFPGRPVDLALAEDGAVLVVKGLRDLVFIDLAANKVKQTLPIGKVGSGFGVVGLLVQGDCVYASDVGDRVHVAQRQADGKYKWLDDLALTAPTVGGLAHPAGMAFNVAGGRLWTTSTRGNSVQLLDLDKRKAEQTVGVGVAPYTIRAVGDHLYVSNWGGDAPAANDPQAKSSGAPIHIDTRTGVADRGSVSVLAVEEGKWKQIKTIAVGLRPCGMAVSARGKFLYVANANSDSVSIIDTHTDKVVETVACRPEGRLPYGSGCNAVAVSPEGDKLYVANGTNNCVAVIRLGAGAADDRDPRPAASEVAGLIPVGWYPGAVLLSPNGKTLYVANVKGQGSLSQPRAVEKGKNSRDYLGSVSIIEVPDARKLAEYTKQVNENNRLGYSIVGLDKPHSDAKPIPMPRRHGEPSLFKHVIYVIKENRTYDQILGDMKEGDGEPKLCLFGEEVTPNHHALARQFTLFDNFYCSGVLSADGHCWTDQAYCGDYLEKAFGGFTRSYPDDGSDPLAYAAPGFLWDNALAHKKTFRNYGEYVANQFDPKKARWADLYADYRNGTAKVKVTAKANLKSLEPYTHPGYPWFPLVMPDVYRARIFLDELKGFERKGDMPNLIYLTLPCDHSTGLSPGYPTPRASVADNDLALGQIVEGVSKSKFWKDTCIFVVEDDPQSGFDHVDGHRTVAFAISPYTKRKFVDHTAYNQTGMVKSIELILGLPPMNQLDLSATPMKNCFTAEPDLGPYECVPNRIKLDEMNLSLDKLKGTALHWAEKSAEQDLDDGDKADDDALNRILWYSVRGDNIPYPVEFAAPKEDPKSEDSP